MRRGTPAAEEFGRELAHRRMSKGLSMRALAAQLGVYAATVSQVEKGQRAIKEPNLALWANALGVSERGLRARWLELQKKYPDGPIVRRKKSAIKTDELVVLVLELFAPERERVRGYIEAVIEQRNLTNVQES